MERRRIKKERRLGRAGRADSDKNEVVDERGGEE